MCVALGTPEAHCTTAQPFSAQSNTSAAPVQTDKDHRDILSHEFAHTLLDWGFPEATSRALKAELEAARASGSAAGRWRGAYCATNADEFWAELVMWVVGSRGDYGQVTPSPRPGRRWLQRYDPDACRLVQSILRGTHPLLQPVAHQAPEAVAELALQTDGLATSCTGDGDACTLLIVNSTRVAAQLSWVDADGGVRPYAVVPPDSSTGQATYVGHVWQLSSAAAADETAVVWGRFIACSGLGVLRLTDAAAAAAEAAVAPLAASAAPLAADEQPALESPPLQVVRAGGADFAVNMCLTAVR